MPWPACFLDAHCRHWRDAEWLREGCRWANADHLYGLSAECGLKAVMEALGMAVDDAGTPAAMEHRKHIRELWPTFLAFVQGRNGARYAEVLPAGKPFGSWSHHDRYAASHHFQANDVEPHRAAALRVCDMVALAKQDGQL